MVQFFKDEKTKRPNNQQTQKGIQPFVILSFIKQK